MQHTIVYNIAPNNLTANKTNEIFKTTITHN